MGGNNPYKDIGFNELVINFITELDAGTSACDILDTEESVLWL